MFSRFNSKSKQEKSQKLAANAALSASADETRKGAHLQTLRGMRDILPEEMPHWNAVFRAAAEVAREYRCEQLVVPLLEPTHLFARSVGETTDIVEKEMYTFQDRSDESVTLRPEFTASFARAYIEHGMLNRPQPVRLWDIGPVFRYDRPQAGRYRQFWQVNFEIMGDAHAVIDAQLIAASQSLYQKLGIPTRYLINSIGDQTCRMNFIRTLTEYLRARADDFCEDCQRRIERNPLRVLDCKQAQCQPLLVDAPQIVDWLCEACRDHFIKVLEYLDELEIPYALEPRLVRGLDYYTRTTFEVLLREDELQGGGGEGEGQGQSVLGGGGRYDDLIGILGGRVTPASGFAAGIERIILAMQRVGAKPVRSFPPHIFLAQLGNEARKKCLRLFHDLRERGFSVAEQFSKDGLSVQLESAAKLGCRYTLIVGQKELIDGTIIIRDMESGIQEIVEFTKIVTELEKRISPRDLATSVASSVASPIVALFQETHRIDLKREEYLLRETVIETEDIVPAEGGEETESVSVERTGEEGWEEEKSETEKESHGGLSWVSKDYTEDQFDDTT